MRIAKIKRYFLASLFLFFIIPGFKNGRVILQLQNDYNPNSSSTELINVVNSLRISSGLPPYRINSTLMLIAQTHTDYQASIGTTTHYGPDGSRPFQRALSAGYPVAGDLNQGGFFSENITAGRNISASDAVNSWKLDAPHLNTMLSPNLQDIGAGVTVVGEITYYTIDVGLSTSNVIISTQVGNNVPTYHPIIVKKILTSTPGLDGSINHIVEIGETIWEISQIYKISPEKLIELNSLKNDFIFVGDKLIIQLPFTPTPAAPTSTPTQIISSTPSLTATLTSQLTTTITSQSSAMMTKNQTNSQNNMLLIIVTLTLLASVIITFFGKGIKH